MTLNFVRHTYTLANIDCYENFRIWRANYSNRKVAKYVTTPSPTPACIELHYAFL